jgi:hypothetical protein
MKITPLTPTTDEEERLYIEAPIKIFLRDYFARESWSFLDACLLIHLLNPKDPSVQRLALRCELPPDIEKFRVLMEADADRELKTTVIKNVRRVTPADFLSWLKLKRIRPPALFKETAMVAMSGRPLTANQLRKQKTQEKREACNDEYARLLKEKPNLSKNAAAKIISRKDVGRDNDSETIRKYLRTPKKKVGR